MVKFCYTLMCEQLPPACEVAEFFGIPAARLTLVDPRFYHLDTALAVLNDTVVAYWPGAFDRTSQRILRDPHPDAIRATEADAARQSLNITCDGSTVLLASRHSRLARQSATAG